MKSFGAIGLACALLVCACTTQPRQAVPPANAAAAAARLYGCESGATVVASYPDTDTATIEYRAVTYRLQIAVSGSGARYVGGRLEWWTKGSGPGSEGTLFRHLADGTTGEPLELCTAR
ncbi:MAG: MliC family protein [Proteobacteria bacterium]|nr:MliC family protein [Pseudomonadota bacterium]